ncbi:MAG TPA: response regulator transcription factor [Actinomycetota bacterium]|nr:response regulator transcription factor [Actinomycetota bacterium]
MTIRVLLADDDSDLRLSLKWTLDYDGRFAVVGEAGDGEETLRLVQEQQPDALVLDLKMPKLDGLAALPKLREAAPEMKIVVWSGVRIERQALLNSGADEVLEKVGENRSVATKLAELCSNKVES